MSEQPKPPMTFGRFRNRMASGIVVLIPIVVTVLVVRMLFSFTAGILLPVVDPAVESWPPISRAVLSLGILLVAIYLLGTLATQAVGRRVLSLVDAVVLRVPFVKVVYSASKQVVTAFEGRKAAAFKSVVFVEFPRPGMQAIGFVTSTFVREGTTYSTIFVPTTPNPTTGFLQILPTSELVRTDITVEEGVKMIMSLGVLTPERAVPMGAHGAPR